MVKINLTCVALVGSIIFCLPKWGDACERLVPPRFAIVQGDGTWVTFQLKQTGSNVHGHAKYATTRTSVLGNVSGNINKDIISFRVFWTYSGLGSIGRYFGKFTPQGTISDGRTYDENASPAIVISWYTRTSFPCVDSQVKVTPKSLGRVKVPPTTDATPQSICDSARSARARNSPAAPALEAQCQASGEIQYKSLGRVKTSATTNLPPRTICESAQSARARNSPAAPALEAQCKAQEAQEAQEAQTKVLETEPVEVQNPALQVVAPKATNAEDTKLDPNNPELEWPMQ
jgi:hypothetical protein